MDFSLPCHSRKCIIVSSSSNCFKMHWETSCWCFLITKRLRQIKKTSQCLVSKLKATFRTIHTFCLATTKCHLIVTTRSQWTQAICCNKPVASTLKPNYKQRCKSISARRLSRSKCYLRIYTRHAMQGTKLKAIWKWISVRTTRTMIPTMLILLRRRLKIWNSRLKADHLRLSLRSWFRGS